MGTYVRSLLVAGCVIGSALVPTAAAATRPMSAEIGRRFTKALVKSAAPCKSKMKAVDLAGVRAMASCLSAAAQAAAQGALAELARGLFDEFLRQLRRGAAAARRALLALVRRIRAFAPEVAFLGAQVMRRITGRSAAIAPRAQKCRSTLARVDRGSARRLFTCLVAAVGRPGARP